MNNATGLQPPGPGIRGLLATIWPVAGPEDSDGQRRKKLAIRSGHLAMAVLILAAVCGAIMTGFTELQRLQVAALVGAGVAFIAWNLVGTRDVVRLALWDRAETPFPSQMPRRRAMVYFGVQFILAGLVYALGDLGHYPTLVWLALLPPVAYGVFLLDRRGIAVVSVLTLSLYAVNVWRWHGWRGLPYGLVAFSFAMLFTLVFTLLAVSAEKSRAEVQRLAGALSEANRKLREYAVQAEELAVTRERNRLAREVHDTLGHYLTVVNVQLEAERAVRDRDPARACDALDRAQSLTQEGLREIRRSVATLRASPLDNRSLADALAQLVAEGCAAGLRISFQVVGEVRLLAPPAELTLYRAGQEGLTNVRKHAPAARVRMTLDFQQPARVRLSLSDDGPGASQDTLGQAGFGLLGLRERTQLLGGEVLVRTAPGQGFSLTVEVPG